MRSARSQVALALAVVMAAVAAAPTRHVGAGIARRAAFHERQRAERAELEAAGGAVLPPENTNVAHVRESNVLDGVAESEPNYTLLKPKEKEKERRKRQREAATAAQAQAAAHAASTDGAEDVAAAEEQQHMQASVAVAQAAAERGGTVYHYVRGDAWQVRIATQQMRHATAALCCLAYAASLAASWLTGELLDGELPLFWTALVADVVGTVIIFLASLYADNSSVYDPYWMVAPPFLLLWLKHASLGLFGPWHPRQMIAITLVTSWSLRFHLHLPWSGWLSGLQHEDWRYSDWRAKLSPGLVYWSFAFSSFHLFPTLIVFFALAPAALVVADTVVAQPSLNALDVVGACFGCAAIAIEAVADETLRRYKTTAAYAAGEPCRAGLWSWSRHPSNEPRDSNSGFSLHTPWAPRCLPALHFFHPAFSSRPAADYFGEVLLWFSLLPIGIGGGQFEAAPWLPAGALAMLALIRGASVPMMDERSLARRGQGYAALMREVSALVPLPPRGHGGLRSCSGGRLWSRMESERGDVEVVL